MKAQKSTIQGLGKVLLLCGAMLYAGGSAATVFDFNVQYDGSTVTDLGPDTVIGTNVQVGDHIDYTVQAAGNDFWQVDAANGFFPFLAFTIDESGTRGVSFSLKLLLDGVEQFFNPLHVTSNSFVHLGTNTVNLAAGLAFDTIELSLDLDSSDVANTTITDYGIGPNFPGGFNDGISYHQAAVPAPGVLALLGIGLLGAFARRRGSL